MTAAELLHSLVGRPWKLQGHVHAAALVLAAIKDLRISEAAVHAKKQREIHEGTHVHTSARVDVGVREDLPTCGWREVICQ